MRARLLIPVVAAMLLPIGAAEAASADSPQVTGVNSVALVEQGTIRYRDRIHFTTTLAEEPRKGEVFSVRVDCGQWGADGFYWVYAQKSPDLATAETTGFKLTRKASDPSLIWELALKAKWDTSRVANCGAVLEKYVTTHSGTTTYALARTNFDVAERLLSTGP